jgi:hypothetical protein
MQRSVGVETLILCGDSGYSSAGHGRADTTDSRRLSSHTGDTSRTYRRELVRFKRTPDVGRCHTLRSSTTTRGADTDGRATQPMDARSHARTGGTTDGERHATMGPATDPSNRNASARNAHSAPHALERSSQKLCLELHGGLPAERICLLGGVQQPVPDVRHRGTNGVPRTSGVHRAPARPSLAERGRRRANTGGQRFPPTLLLAL